MLTKQQVLFIHEYLKDNNATQAAIRAGYSATSASKYAYTILHKPEVQSYLKEIRVKVREQVSITLEALVAEYTRIAFFDVRKLFDENGQPIPVQNLPPEIATITSLELFSRPGGTGHLQRIRIKDRILALNKIAQLLGFSDPKKEPGELVVNWYDNTGHGTIPPPNK